MNRPVEFIKYAPPLKDVVYVLYVIEYGCKQSFGAQLEFHVSFKQPILFYLVNEGPFHGPLTKKNSNHVIFMHIFHSCPNF